MIIYNCNILLSEKFLLEISVRNGFSSLEELLLRTVIQTIQKFLWLPGSSKSNLKFNHSSYGDITGF